MNKKLVAVLSLILVIALFSTLYFYSKKPLIDLNQRVTIAAQKGGQWLLNYQSDYKDPGVLWVIKTVNGKYCQKPELDRFVEQKFENEFADHPIERSYARLITGATSSLPAETLVKQSVFKYDNIILPAIYCDLQSVATSTLDKIFNVSQASSYDLTHRYLAMLFMKQNRCLAQPQANVLVEAENKIAAELSRTQNFSDLLAEQIALLTYGDYEPLNENWFRILIKKQKLSGAWTDPFLNKESPHTTTLSLLALSEYGKTCPFNR